MESFTQIFHTIFWLRKIQDQSINDIKKYQIRVIFKI